MERVRALRGELAERGAVRRFLGHQFRALSSVPAPPPAQVQFPQALPAGTQYWKYGPAAAIPTLNEWGLALLAGLLAAFGWRSIRGRDGYNRR